MTCSSRLISLLIVLSLTGCGDDVTPVRPDGGGPDPDTGSMTGDCGEVGQTCCSSGSTRCQTGSVCGPDRTCCGIPQGAACSNEDDCCGTLDCVGGSCCAVADSPCRTANECCSGLVCDTSSGRCTGGGEDCGMVGQDCCEGGSCGDGATCVDGSCAACGGDGDLCCRGASNCDPGLICNGEGRCAAPSGDCGALGMSCCTPGNTCAGGLVCKSGMCEEPEGTCADFTACGTCAGAPAGNCGWCEASGECQEGTASGPATGSCADWKFGTDACMTLPDTCSMNTDCFDCLRDFSGSDFCGWCGDLTTGSCHAGDGDAAFDGTCSDATGNWAYALGECSSVFDPCDVHTTCGACNTDMNCDWCESAGSCHTVGAAPPGCTLTDTCPDPCGAFDGDCMGCTDAVPDCFLCEDDNTCLPYSSPRICAAGEIYNSFACGGMCTPVDGSSTAQDCMMDSDCCMGGSGVSCRRGVSFTSPNCCIEAGQPCMLGGDCCGYMDCGASGTCECRNAGRACWEDGDCCSNNCTASGTSSGTCV